MAKGCRALDWYNQSSAAFAVQKVRGMPSVMSSKFSVKSVASMEYETGPILT